MSCPRIYFFSLFKNLSKKIFAIAFPFTLTLFFITSSLSVLYIQKNPVASLYAFLDQQQSESIFFLRKIYTYPREALKEKLYQGEKILHNFVQKNYFLRRPSRFAFLDSFFNALTPLQIYTYRLGTEDKLSWNRYVKENLPIQEYYETPDGWHLPKSTRRNQNILLPQDYYFSKAQNINLNAASGIYVNGIHLSQQSILKQIDYCQKNNLNTLVIDIKDVTGFLNYQSSEKDLQEIQRGIYAAIKNLKLYVDMLHQHNIYVIARVSLFHDYHYGTKNPQAVLRHPNGEPYHSGKNTLWLDPSQSEVQNYNIKIIWESLRAGVDEIQLDYIRYPAEKKWQDVIYPRVKNYHDKTSHLLSFLQRVHALTKSQGARLSIDVFGITIFQEKSDVYSTGQDLVFLSQAADILSPMIYPSHYADGFHGFAKPGEKPYEVALLNLSRIKDLNFNQIEVRPWLQAFAWRAPNYSARYVEDQIRAVLDSGYNSFLLWNASSRYPALMPLKKNSFLDKHSDINRDEKKTNS